jgi:hypothetical protein
MLRGRSAGTDRKQYAREQREKRTASGLHSRAGSFAPSGFVSAMAEGEVAPQSCLRGG